jgi:FkbM family methyltransferase
MTTPARIRSALNNVLAPLGFTLARRHELASAVEDRWRMSAALRRAAMLGVQPASIIDLGAAVGEWSQLAHSIFPDADCVLVEPLLERATALRAFCEQHPRMRHIAVAAGASQGQVLFDVSSDLDGSGVYGGTSGSSARLVPVETVDAIVRVQGLRPPFLLKLDTHGYELPILAGAAETLAHTALIVMEVYNFSISPTAVPFWEICATLATRGFRPADVCGLMHRPRDRIFWQADFFFLPAKHPNFLDARYSE